MIKLRRKGTFEKCFSGTKWGMKIWSGSSWLNMERVYYGDETSGSVTVNFVVWTTLVIQGRSGSSYLIRSKCGTLFATGTYIFVFRVLGSIPIKKRVSCVGYIAPCNLDSAPLLVSPLPTCAVIWSQVKHEHVTRTWVMSLVLARYSSCWLQYTLQVIRSCCFGNRDCSGLDV